ncbi:hypothetical protein SAMN05444394_0135 [Algoriphagus halophilus]|uniref:Uncharacterized protein n=1 Tax=Algoriphagus halophilus TaxID=226505 RepID=A0A1N6D3L5_9BACT|nr:hypothetical protein SAMN05444394_0135 [Algoriphagus halophilus]
MKSIFSTILLIVIVAVAIFIGLGILTAILTAFENLIIAIWPFLLGGVVIYGIFKMFFDK